MAGPCRGARAHVTGGVTRDVTGGVTEQPTPLDDLQREPARFTFDAAVRVLMWAARVAEPSRAARFRTTPGLAFPTSEVLHVAPQAGKPPYVEQSVIGLTGPAGVLPRPYTERAVTALRSQRPGLHEFLELFSGHAASLFASAGLKYRPTRAMDCAELSGEPDPIAQAVLAFAGWATPGLAGRVAAGEAALLHYAGLLAMRPRSAERLEAMLSDWLGRPVEVVQFAGAWLRLPADQQTRLGVRGQFTRLGVDAAVGARSWDPHARFIVRIGPLTRTEFERLLPHHGALQALVSLVRAFVGLEVGFAVNPVLRRAEVPALVLGAGTEQPRLGWNTWLPSPTASVVPLPDAADAMFEAEAVERTEAGA